MVIAGGETIESLLEASRTPEGRSRLFSSFPSLLSSILSSPPLLLPHLRLIRNLLASSSSPFLLPFLQSDGPNLIISPLLSLPSDLLRASLQILANLSLSLPRDHLSYLWVPLSSSSPLLLLSLARIRDPKVSAPLSMLLYNCLPLADTQTQIPIVAQLVVTASTVGYDEEWLDWILSRVCLEEPHFAPLLDRLDLSQREFLLSVLSDTLSVRPDDVDVVSESFALEVLRLAGDDASSADVVRHSVAILRDVCARDDSSDVVDSLVSSGLLEFLLNSLRELGPPAIVRKSNGTVKTEPLKESPYQGFRKDLVSVIANCLHRRKKAQDEVRERSGIFLLMQQCVVDEQNPFLREWGMLTIRNLLEGNEENQKEVSELQLQGPVDTPEISGLGLKVEIDEKSGRAKLVNIS